jgi:hypothetical protein
MVTWRYFDDLWQPPGLRNSFEDAESAENLK